MVKSLRQKQSEETRDALLKAGRKLFAKKGFAGTSAEEIVSKARVTRGALYHHFARGKPGLFEAVARNLQTELVSVMTRSAKAENEPWVAMRAAIAAYFDFADNPAYQQIILHDAPAVFGANEWRSIEHEYSLRFIQRGLEQLTELGEIRMIQIPMLASVIFGACCDATLTIAEANQTAKAKTEATNIILELLHGLRTAT